MNLPNPDLLKSLRRPGLCECCKRPCKMRCGAHIFSVGAGRVDISWNLISTAMSPQHGCDCHQRSHSGRSPSRLDFLKIASKREGVAVDVIEGTIQAIRALPRPNTMEQAEAWLLKHISVDVYAQHAIRIILASNLLPSGDLT